MTHLLIQKIEKKYLRTDLPEIAPGDYIKIWQKVKEAKKETLQTFQGIIIAIKGGKGIKRMITVRGEAAGQMIEKTYPFHSPVIDKIKILKKAKTRRAKLYFIRNLHPKEMRRKLKIAI